MDETEVMQEEQTEQESEQEQESVQASETRETQAEADNSEKAAEAETEEPKTGQSNGGSESATHTETTVYVADIGNLEELTAEANMLLTEQNELLADIHGGITVLVVLLGMLLGMLSVSIFGGAMNHDHK